MNKNTLTTLALGAAILASCTLEKDAQHGISFEFQHPNQRSKSEVRDQPERIASTTTSVSSPAAATTDWVAAPATTYAAAPSEFWTTPAESYDEPTYAEPTAIADEAPAAVEPSIDATEEVAEETVVVAQKKSWAQRLVEFMAPDNEMVIAALLAFFLGGFGAHWFYLGERGRGMARLLVTLGGLLLFIIGAVMYVAAGGASILGAAIAFIALLALFANQILVIIVLVNILTDNW